MKLPQVLFVTGKGGTGKSTVAAALAIAIGRRHPVTLLDLTRREPVIDLEGAAGAKGAGPERIVLTARAELESFIQRLVPLKTIARRMLRSRTFGFVTTALPGLEAFLLLERLRLLAVSAERDRRFVVDAPGTGSALELLSVAGGIARIAPAGTLNRLAREVGDFLCAGDRFGVILTTQAEALSIRETIEAAAAIGKLGMQIRATVLNRVVTVLFSAAEIAKLAGLTDHLRLAERHRAAANAATQARRDLAAAGLDSVVLPMLYRREIARAELHKLAEILDRGLNS
jgi:arsenite-transporting ATPase